MSDGAVIREIIAPRGDAEWVEFVLDFYRRAERIELVRGVHMVNAGAYAQLPAALADKIHDGFNQALMRLQGKAA